MLSTMKKNLFLLGLAFTLAAPVLRAEHEFETDEQREPSIETGGNCVIRNVTIHTAVRPAFVGDVLVKNGVIAAVGEVDAPADIVEIDGTGKHLAPGVVDCHSHMAIDRGVNEGTVSITAEVTMKDVVDADDVGIYRALAGGVTTIRLLHGSANTIGGRDEVLKLKWHENAEALRFPGAPQGIKFALGENVKRSGQRGVRFPGSRMGVEAIFYRAFERAKEYRAGWEAYETAKARGEDAVPPRRDIRLDVLVGILDGSVHVHSHCYRADEILMLIRASQHFGFQIATLQHVLEGYKVAHEMAEAGVGGSTFGDWWAYKIEAYDAIPHNAALMHEAGVLASLNSDSDEMIRRLYGEAAKSVRYAGLDRVEALKLVTLNPARQLGIGERVGSIEVGKDADLALLTADPLSSLARVELTIVDGEVEFERYDTFGFDANSLEVSELSEDEREPVTLDPDAPVIALVGGTLHPVTSPVIENGTLLMQNGRIVALGSEVDVPANAERVDVSGQHVWPGLISVNSAIGLHEIGAVNETNDTREIGGNQPDVRVSAAINADSAHIGVTRHNGITRAQTTPQGGGPVMGQSAVVRLEGGTWEEMLTVDRDMLHVSFPRTSNTAKDKDKKKESDTLKELRQLFEDAAEYARIKAEAIDSGFTLPPYDPRLEAMTPYVHGDRPVAFHASNAQTILAAVKFARELELDPVIYGGTEAWKVADVLAAEDVPVVAGPVWRLPGQYDPYDAPFANAALLARAGVRFAIMTDDSENERNLPFHAATAVAFGLPHDEAVRAITYYPAELLGIEADFGSLATGKVADVIVTSGDLLEITSSVERMFIDGEPIDHRSDRHTRYYERYRARLHSLQTGN